jgi:hypothetical protein
MADVDQLLLELRAVQKKFELARPISDFDRSFLVFGQLRKDGNVCLWRVLTCGYLRSIPGGPRAPNLFDDLIGLSPSEHLTQDIFGSFWCVKAGLIDQPEVWTDIQSKQAPDEMAVWNECGFHLLTGCANGLGRLIEIVEREMAADHQADKDGVIDSVARSMVWGNDKFNDIPPRGIKVLSLLLDAYRDGNRVVTLGEIEVLEVSVDGGMIDQVFRVKGKRHPVSKIIENLRGGRYRLKPPRKNT